MTDRDDQLQLVLPGSGYVDFLGGSRAGHGAAVVRLHAVQPNLKDHGTAGAHLVVDADGTVEIIASATPHGKNWLPLAPDSTGLVVRQTYMDRITEVPGLWHIERIGEPVQRKELNPEHFAKALATAAFSLHGTAAMFANWTEMFMAQPNEMPDFGQEFFQKAGGDPEIFYAHGYWTLKPGQAWVIETEVPDCPYWNFQLDNWWMESLDHERKMTINKHTAKLNDDGTLTIEEWR